MSTAYSFESDTGEFDVDAYLSERRLPPQFGGWKSPWYITTVEGADEVWTVWVREYRTESTCDAPGCCEFVLPHLGPRLAVEAA